jgi:hypothetical protein
MSITGMFAGVILLVCALWAVSLIAEHYYELRYGAYLRRLNKIRKRCSKINLNRHKEERLQVLWGRKYDKPWEGRKG